MIRYYTDKNKIVLGVWHIKNYNTEYNEHNFNYLSKYILDIIPKNISKNDIIILFECGLFEWAIEALNFNAYNISNFVYSFNDHKYLSYITCMLFAISSNAYNDECLKRSVYMSGNIDRIQNLYPKKLIISIVGIKHVEQIYNIDKYKDDNIECYLDGLNDTFIIPKKNYKLNYIEKIIDKYQHVINISLILFTFCFVISKLRI